VVITHDEEFMSVVGREASSECYYRVSKDVNQNSQIERLQFNALTVAN
jgi:hypothetical protein